MTEAHSSRMINEHICKYYQVWARQCVFLTSVVIQHITNIFWVIELTVVTYPYPQHFHMSALVDVEQ